MKKLEELTINGKTFIVYELPVDFDDPCQGCYFFKNRLKSSSICGPGGDEYNHCSDWRNSGKLVVFKNVEIIIKGQEYALYYAFANSKYIQFRTLGTDGLFAVPHIPNIEAINQYALKHWSKTVPEMNSRELSRFIAIVKKWK
jgi:hypothetical protein